jgi:hypothetical protein
VFRPVLMELTPHATSSLTTNGCTPNPVNEVWYTYTVTGANNTFFLDPGTLQDAVITIYADGCGTGTYDYCTTSAGTADINFNFGLDVGTQVWISIASNTLTDGNFQFCITSSTPPATPPGNTSCSAIAVCEKNKGMSFSDMSIYTASGTKASCFTGPGSNATQEVWISFCASTSGTITWTGDPNNPGTGQTNPEYDWSMWNITNGCPGTEVDCNYAWNQQNGVNFGHGCNTTDCNPAFNVVAGQCYAIQIVNWSNNGVGFAFSGFGGTAQISPNVNFNMTQSNACNIPVTANFTVNTGGGNGHAGTIDWDFGNGNTWSGTGAPPSQTYTEPGTYAVTASGGTGSCYSQQTVYVNVYAPVAATESFVTNICSDGSTGKGSISMYPTGGNGTYTYSWSPNVSSGPNATNLRPWNIRS